MMDTQVSNAVVVGTPRRFWQGAVYVYLLMFLGSVAMMATGRTSPGAVGLAIGGIDLLALVALAGYAWRRPLRGAALQLLVLLLAAIDFFRAGLVVVVLWPNLVPWQGDEHAWQALWTMPTALLLALVATGLYRHATDRSHAG